MSIVRNNFRHSTGDNSDFWRDQAWKGLKWASKKATRKLEEMWHEKNKKSNKRNKPLNPIKHKEYHMRGDVSRESGFSTRAPGVKRIKKGKRNVGSKSVKVSKAFKLKVDKVIEKESCHGNYTEISFGYIDLPDNVNAQRPSAVRNSDYTKWSFDPENWLHLLGVLWKGQGYSQSVQDWQGSVFGGINAGAESVLPNTQNMNLKFHVINSWERRILKNDTGRAMTISVITCAPKKQDFKESTVLSLGPPGASYPNLLSIVDPILFWERCLLQDATNIVNISGIVPETLYESPGRHGAWNKAFSAEIVKVVLEPGQTYEHFMQGPKHMDVNMHELFQQGGYQGIQKFMRYSFYVVHMDLIGANVATGVFSGRPSFQSQFTSGFGLKVERTRYNMFSLPEQVGFKVISPLLGGRVVLGSRRPTYGKAVNGTAYTGPATAIRVDEENPTVPVSSGL